MDFIFFDSRNTLLFSRNDAEEAHWIQHEMQLTATFPFDSSKVITRGMCVGFRDPASGNIEVFEIRNLQNIEPDHYQQLTAESIAIADLSDEHINNAKIDNLNPRDVLSRALSGVSDWHVGNVSATNVSSCDFARGTVWQAVKTIEENWNVYCIPRIVVNASGIAGKYIDIVPSGGTYHGLRLSISKNLADSSVTYDDSEVYTALYGYGGSISKKTSASNESEELTFSSVSWSKTSAHPAKPSGQTYLEYPEKTALYGRNGKPRFGYYQNSDIKDAETLLEKTWEALKETCEPKISISCTVADLYRFGYADAPIRLHDIAVVEIAETGELFHKEIITADINLLDPSATSLEIGDYISNIIYISRDTKKSAKGRGGGGGKGQSNTEKDLSDTYTLFEKTDSLIGMVVGTRNGGYYIKAGEIALAINKSGDGEYESTALINANHINISATQDVHTLAGDIEHDENGNLVIKNAGGLYVRRTEDGVTSQFGVWDNGNLTGGVMVQKINGTTETTIRADKINIDGIVTALAAKHVGVGSLEVEGATEFKGTVYCEVGLSAEEKVRSNTGFDPGTNTVHTEHSLKINGVEKAKFLGTADVNFTNASVTVTLEDSGWQINDASTGDYTRTFTPKKDGVAVASQVKTISAQSIWNLGWNACRSWVLDHSHSVVEGCTSWNSNDNATALYVAPQSGAAKATGRDQVWRYGGSKKTYYSAPSAK